MNDGEPWCVDTKRSLRDWFAGMALAGGIIMDENKSYSDMAEAAYLLADSMMEERAKEY
jgi:hypothetical protein